MHSMRLMSIWLVVLGLVVGACATVPPKPLTEGELRLTTLRSPKVVRDNVPYLVEVLFESNGVPPIKRACFRLSAESPFGKIPPGYCNKLEADGDLTHHRACARYLKGGMVQGVSDLYCTDVQTIDYGPPGVFQVYVLSEQKGDFRLYCYAEYVLEGEVTLSNAVSQSIRVGY